MKQPDLLALDTDDLTLMRDSWQEFLTPEQRLQIVADILGAIAVRIIKQQDEQTNPQS